MLIARNDIGLRERSGVSNNRNLFVTGNQLRLSWCAGLGRPGSLYRACRLGHT